MTWGFIAIREATGAVFAIWSHWLAVSVEGVVAEDGMNFVEYLLHVVRSWSSFLYAGRVVAVL